jgi:hypothetical protein
MLLTMDGHELPASAYVNNTRIAPCKYRGPSGGTEFGPGGKVTGKLADSRGKSPKWDGLVRRSVGENFERYSRTFRSQDPDRQCDNDH